MNEPLISNSKSPGKQKIVWVSLLVYDYANTVSQTEILRHLRKRGFDVHLVAQRSKKREHKKNSDMHLTLFPIRYTPVISSLVGALVLLLYLPVNMFREKPNYIVTTSDTSIFGYLLKLFPHPLKPKVVLDIRSTPVEVKGSFREYLHRLVFRVSMILAKRRLNGITTLTERMKKEICDNFNISPTFVGVWTSGVSTQVFTPDKIDRTEMRNTLGLNDKFVVFHHGALSKARGIAQAIKSIEILKSRYSDLTLFLLGTGSGVEALRNTAEELGVQDRVIMHGWVNYSDVPKYVAMCDVAIVPLPDSPSWRYQCPLKLLEYLAMKKVVIVTDIPANREVIGNHPCGIYVSSSNPQEIAEAIAFAHENREKLAEWGKSGREIIKEKYTWEKVAEDFYDYLSKL
jgi:glycosyltransferase involved in cell wall biosynthesis